MYENKIYINLRNFKIQYVPFLAQPKVKTVRASSGQWVKLIIRVGSGNLPLHINVGFLF